MSFRLELTVAQMAGGHNLAKCVPTTNGLWSDRPEPAVIVSLGQTG